jgi:hypothetical protein
MLGEAGSALFCRRRSTRYDGGPEKFCVSCVKGAQDCAESQKRFRVGLMDEASSSVPEGMITMFGATPASHTTADPHSGQKRRVTGLPLPPSLVNVLLSPSTLKVSFGMNARVAKAAPE